MEGSETRSEKPVSKLGLTFSSASSRAGNHKNTNISQSIKEEIKSLKQFSKSYLILIWCLMIKSCFFVLLGLANTKYIQSKLHGQPSDLASLDFFTSLVTVAAPLGALIMDSYYPFKRKIGPYLIAAQVLEAISVACVGLFDQTTSSFILLMCLRAIGYGLTTTITQGLLAHKTKIDIQILDLEEYLRTMDRTGINDETGQASERGLSVREKRDRAGIKIYTMYTIYNALFHGLSDIWCGFAVDSLKIENVYLLATTPYIFITFVTVFILKEQPEPSSFPQGESVFEAAKKFKEVIFSPLLLYPITLLLLSNLTPDAGEAI